MRTIKHIFMSFSPYFITGIYAECKYPRTLNLSPIPAWGQCGGSSYTYRDIECPGLGDRETCEMGYHCRAISSAYYQCVPTVVPYYGQCGGPEYTGFTICTKGSTCKVFPTGFAQCVPDLPSTKV